MTQTLQEPRLRLPRGIDRFAAELIRQMEDDGWTGRFTANGHIIMRAPDSGPTCSIAPKTGSPTRSRANTAMVYKRWKREQQTGC